MYSLSSGNRNIVGKRGGRDEREGDREQSRVILVPTIRGNNYL